jgi:hypothetical protein
MKSRLLTGMLVEQVRYLIIKINSTVITIQTITIGRTAHYAIWPQ